MKRQAPLVVNFTHAHCSTGHMLVEEPTACGLYIKKNKGKVFVI